MAHLFDELDKHPSVDYRGTIPGDQVPDLLGSSVAGLMFMRPDKNHLDALPTKVFEYMAAGIPFIASNLPALVESLEKWDCGVFVDTVQDSSEAQRAAVELMADPQRCHEMGVRGRRAIEEEFNFEADVPALIEVEQHALKRPDSRIVEG